MVGNVLINFNGVHTLYTSFIEGNQNMKVYLKEELPERFHYKNNDRITSIVILAEPGYDVYPVSYWKAILNTLQKPVCKTTLLTWYKLDNYFSK